MAATNSLIDRSDRLRVVEDRPFPGGEVRDVEDRDRPLHLSNELEYLLAGTEDVGVTARLDPETDLTLRQGAQPRREVGHDLGQFLDRIRPGSSTVESEVGHRESRPETVREHARPLDLAGRLLPCVRRAEEIDVVRRMQGQVDVERPRELLGQVQVGVVLGEAPGQSGERVLALQRGRERGGEGRGRDRVGGAQVHDELLEEVVRDLPHLLVEDRAGQRVYLDELDFHGREAEMVHVRNSIAERPPLARERDPRGSEPNQE